MGNFMCADENPALAVARVAPYTRYVHAKDFIWRSYNDADPGEGAFQTRGGNYLRGTIVGHGNVPVKQCLHILKPPGTTRHRHRVRGHGARRGRHAHRPGQLKALLERSLTAPPHSI